MKIKYVLTSIVLGSLLLVGCSSDDEPKEESKAVTKVDKNENNTDANDDENQAENENNKEEDSDTNTKDNSANGDLVTTEFGDITFSYPSILSETSVDNQSVPTFGLNNEDDTIRIILATEELPMEMTSEEYIEVAFTNNGIEPEEVNPLPEVNGLDWTEVISIQQGVQINQRVFVLDQTAYVFSYASESYDDNLNIYDQITQSVKVN